MHLYETHLHTSPVSKCAKAGVRQTLEFYRSLGYRGVFITNHFIDGNIADGAGEDYKSRLDFYFSDYLEGVQIGRELGIEVYLGVEMSYKGTDFLVYGLPLDWWYSHPEITEMKKIDELRLMMDSGALVVQAHPFREASYIDHIRLFPRVVQAVEIYNACRTDFENLMAENYAASYSLIPFAGSDNHVAEARPILGGMQSEKPILDEADFVRGVLDRSIIPFTRLVPCK